MDVVIVLSVDTEQAVNSAVVYCMQDAVDEDEDEDEE